MIRLLRFYFAGLARFMPGTSAGLLARLFTTPGRHGLQSTAGKRLLESAERGSINSISGNVTFYRWRNRGPRVLVLHGWSDQAANLGELIDVLLAAGYDVTAPDLPAHGDSAGNTAHMKQWLVAIRMLSAGVPKWHAVLGHSLGGFAAAASTREDLPHYGTPVKAGKLVLIAPPDRSSTMLRMVAGHLQAPERIIERTASLLSEWIDADFNSFSTAENVANFDGKALVIHDRDDNRVPFAHFEAIREAAPEQDFIATASLGHRRILDNARVQASIVEFLDEAIQVRGARPDAARQLAM
ncbi:MAG: alpha/beta fold hydrolase [Gammaproteobacteria bacterium]|nr:alpha/beta fold hydrolase [Gammaproteobacteria bacterium]